MQDGKMLNKNGLVHFNLTEKILKCCFEVMNELGSGFLESVYKNALFIAMRQSGFSVSTEQSFEVIFRKQKIGRYVADLVVENSVIIELKCCENLASAHQAQLINYLKVADISVGLLVNFGNRKLEYKRVCHPRILTDDDDIEPISLSLHLSGINQNFSGEQFNSLSPFILPIRVSCPSV